ncbi:MAG: hypothetical protein RQ899_01860 [Pseudomonadales bacterium]|nr:hypothetical protein [Pseudomonadales bacterium]
MMITGRRLSGARRCLFSAGFGLCLSLCLYNVSAASTIQKFSMPDLVNLAELIFEGEVTAVRSDELGDGLVYTWVRFRVADVVKGGDPGEQIELRFLGGSMNDRMLSVSDLNMPVPGERGIYFVESLAEGYVNPLLGWSQGHYLIHPDQQGEDRVYATTEPESETAVMADELSALKQKALKAKGPGPAAVGSARTSSAGLSQPEPGNTYLSPAQFKQEIRQLLEPASP